MKFASGAFGICMAAAMAIGLAVPSHAAVTLRIGTVLAPNDPDGSAPREIQERRRGATKGAVKVQVFHNSQLGDTTDMIDQARAGANSAR